jgi:hypothetical protein
VNIVNAADFLEADYNNCRDSCQVTAPFNYMAEVTASNTVNGNFAIQNFGGFGNNITVDANLNGSNISVGASQSLGGTASIVACSGSVTSTSPAQFGLTYTWTDGSANEVCISKYR